MNKKLQRRHDRLDKALTEKDFFEMTYNEQVAYLEKKIADCEAVERHPSVLAVTSDWAQEMALMRKALAYLKGTGQRIEIIQEE